MHYKLSCDDEECPIIWCNVLDGPVHCSLRTGTLVGKRVKKKIGEQSEPSAALERGWG